MPAGVWEEIQDFLRKESVRLGKTISASSYLVQLHRDSIDRRVDKVCSYAFCETPEKFQPAANFSDGENWCKACIEALPNREELHKEKNISVPLDLQGVISEDKTVLGKASVQVFERLDLTQYNYNKDDFFKPLPKHGKKGKK